VKKLSFIAVLAILFVTVIHDNAIAQTFDASFGVGTVLAPSASSASGDHNPVSLTGGAYPAFGADFLFKKNFGVSGELGWRASRNIYGLFGVQPYRPLFYDFGAIYAPRFRKVGAELQAGIGWESIRFYQPFIQCSFVSCTDFVSSNHFMGHFGGGIRYYVWGHVFVRPEAHLYVIHNNVEFSSPIATRVGVSIGYTFAPGF
jgi:hypothetical protein